MSEPRSVIVTIEVTSCHVCPHKGENQHEQGVCAWDGWYIADFDGRAAYLENSDIELGLGLRGSCPLTKSKP